MADQFDDDPYSTHSYRSDIAVSEDGPGARFWLLALAALAALASLGLFALGGGVGVNLIGYVLASLVAFTLVALFRRTSVRRMAQYGIVTSRAPGLVGLLILVSGLVIAALHAYRIARHYG